MYLHNLHKSMHCKCYNVYLLKKREENGTFHLTIEADDTLHDIADDSRDIFFQWIPRKKETNLFFLAAIFTIFKTTIQKVYVFYNV